MCIIESFWHNFVKQLYLNKKIKRVCILHLNFQCSPCIWYIVMLQEGRPIPGPKTGLLSNTQKWIVWGDTCADKARDFIGKGHLGWRAVGSGNQGEQLCHVACSLRFYGGGISFWVVFSQSFWLRALPGGAHLLQARWMPERRILGGGRTCGVSFGRLPNSSGWWRLSSSVFLARSSCRKTTRANGYYGAWPGWAVSINVLPLTWLL